MAYRYWRIYVTATRSTSNYKADIANIEMRTSVGGANQAVGGAVFASSEDIFEGMIGKEFAFDGQTDTNWISAQNAELPQWIGYDFGVPVSIVEVQLTRSDYFPSIARSPRDFEIQASNDNDTWVTISSYANEPEFGYQESRTYAALEPQPVGLNLSAQLEDDVFSLSATANQQFSDGYVLLINEQYIPRSQIHGNITINREEGGAALMDVTLNPPRGVQNLIQYQGKLITLDEVKNGAPTRMFTGIVDIPEIDIIRKKIRLRCTNNRKELNNALDPALVESIGHYSTMVFGEPESLHDELESRLETVPGSLDYDAELNPHYTPWEPKATADIILADPDIYRRTPTIEVTYRGRIINSIHLELTYRFTRLRHRERDFQWFFRGTDEPAGICSQLIDPVTLTPNYIVTRAAEGAGWPLKDEIVFEPLWETGWYTCDGQNIGWQTVSARQEGVVTLKQKLDENNDPVLDENDDPIYEETQESRGSQKDYRNSMCIGASWSASRRFVQQIEQVIHINVRSDASIDQYGEVERPVRYGLEQEYPADEWERYNTHQAPTGLTQSPNGDWISDQRDEELAEFENGVHCATQRARTEILAAHRQNFVTLQLPLMPSIDLRHTVETTAGAIQCKGKVYRIRHTINIRTRFTETEIVLALSRAAELDTESPYAIQYPSITDASATPAPITLGNWIGGRTTELPPADADGFFTNYFYNRTADGVLYTESFVVRTPAIDDADRDRRVAELHDTWPISVPIDPLQVIL